MANGSWLLFLALALSCHPASASCIEGNEDDEVCLLQMKRDPAKEKQEKGDTCDCMAWSAAYKAGVKCGQGHEVDKSVMPEGGQELGPYGERVWENGLENPGFYGLETHGKEYCDNFFMQLNGNKCAKKAFDHHSDSWCFVSSKCTKNVTNVTVEEEWMFMPVPGVKVKTCLASDAKLGDMKFEELAAYALTNKLDLALMAQFAYPTFKEGKLPEVMEFFGVSSVFSSPLSDGLRVEVQERVDSGATTFFTTATRRPPFAVAEGRKLYWINHADHKEGEAMWLDKHKKGASMWLDKEKHNAWRCVAGCDGAPSEIW